MTDVCKAEPVIVRKPPFIIRERSALSKVPHCKIYLILRHMLYDMRSKPEYEANIVAAEILLDNDELLDYIYYYRYSAEQIARAMHTDINLVALKIAHLNELGYDLRPIEHRSKGHELGRRCNS